jgi:hypothetical protein
MRTLLSIRFVSLSVILALAACGGGGGDDGNTGGTGGGGTGGSGTGGSGTGGSGGGTTVPTGATPNGLFDVHYVSADPAHTEVSGIMNDGLPAELVVWDKKNTDGDCSLYTPRTPFCSACASGQVCVDTEVCRTPPASHPVGKVTVTGLTAPSGANPIELTPITTSTSTNYLCAETLPLSACTAGGAIQLAAAGQGDYPAFNIQSQCIAPLAITTTSFALESGKAFALTWTPGAIADARVTVELDLSHHGGSKGQLRCTTADTGSLQISATMVKTLMDLGVTGFPWLTVTRAMTGKAAVGSGQAQLKVYSDERYILEIPGLKSCDRDTDCPTGQTCLTPGMMCGVSCTTNADCPTGQTCPAATKICK